MKIWPNWVDLIIVTIVFRTCYTGMVRGMVLALLNLAAAVIGTSIAVNYSGWLAGRVVLLVPWSKPMLLRYVLFWVVLCCMLLIAHLGIRWMGRFIKWERVHWVIQGTGGALGAVRGMWWSALILVALSSSGFPYLLSSVEERSVVGIRLAGAARRILERTADRFPGAQYQAGTLIPPVKTMIEPRRRRSSQLGRPG